MGARGLEQQRQGAVKNDAGITVRDLAAEESHEVGAGLALPAREHVEPREEILIRERGRDAEGSRRPDNPRGASRPRKSIPQFRDRVRNSLPSRKEFG